MCQFVEASVPFLQNVLCFVEAAAVLDSTKGVVFCRIDGLLQNLVVL